MNRGDIVRRIRSYTRDISASIFRTIDLTDFINESIDRFRTRITHLSGMAYLGADDETPSLLPSQYHYLIAVYAASRCFGQDERHYQASTLMNEFEVKLEELFGDIQDGIVVITDGSGNIVTDSAKPGYVVIEYFASDTSDDEDIGVDGVPS